MSQDTRKKLLEGAQKCLVQEGFRKTSVKAIAHYAGVNLGLVHHYFIIKEFMDTQKNLMMFSIIISVVYGIWAIFAPGSIMST